ncbi:nitroreductase [Acetobacteroides hydrogenigenes]|uniref:Nitroreductase n=2 Tax=Acetobacteroides hydrogenigenes TaxID=979970 RepID=A0A4R2EP07_9BACT|nr:nitroreductase [Acetobacteroides hydrogenigenes]
MNHLNPYKMNFLELVKHRASVRSFSERAVEAKTLEYILECARLAPSAVNYQPWRFFVVSSAEAKKALQRCYNREWFTSAPLYILACGDSGKSWKRGSDGKDHLDIDVAIAVEHICLAAAEQGLGTCWVCNFDAALCSQELRLPENLIPVAIIPLGYPAGEVERRGSRKDIEEIVAEL